MPAAPRAAAAPALALALLLLAAPAVLTLLPAPAARAHAASITDHVVAAHEGTPIAVTVFRPEGADAGHPVPVVLRSHGWAGSRDTEDDGRVGELLDAGYGVVTFDARGHGDSGGQARVHHWDHEVVDVSRLLDWIHDTQPWVQREPGTGIPKDLRVGGSGGSYGGGWQLLAAARDPRLDALVPEITWHSLPRSLAPNGAVKSDWVHLLYAGGVAFVDLAPEIHAAYREAMATNQLPQGIVASFVQSSPGTHLDAIRAPTLLVQGVPDTLFNLNEAAATFEGLAARGVPVRLHTHLGGHLLTAATVNGQLPPVGLQPGPGGEPCGATSSVALAWYDRWLKGNPGVDTGPATALAMDDGACLQGASLAALAAPALRSWTLPVAVEGSALVPLDVAPGSRLAGIPRLAWEVLDPCLPWTVYASLVAAGPGGLRVLDAQVTPLRSNPPPGALPCAGTAAGAVDLGGVGAVLRAGEALALKLDVAHEQFATNGERGPQAPVFARLDVTLPLAP